MSVLYGLTFGLIKAASITCFKTTSRGCPSRSYMARKNIGNMMMIIPMAASVVFPVFLIRKYAGMPMAAPIEKQISCLFVRLKNTFDLTRVRSLGTDI